MTHPDYTPLWHWVREREAMLIKRRNGEPAPWTDDPILSKFRFCNVRREDDRVTIWIRQNIRERFADHPQLWLMLCIARQINWIDTLKEIIAGDGFPSNEGWLERMATIMHARQARKEKVYTGAYTITAPSTKGVSKIDFTCQTVIGQLWRDRERIERMLFAKEQIYIQRAHALLFQYKAWGGDGFMAYQAIGDMIFTKILCNAPDRESWCEAGPCTIRGLNRTHGRPVDFKLPQDQARAEIRKIYALVEKETGVPVAFNDVPNILCETDKYLRVKNGEGEPRALYVTQGPIE